MAITKCKECGGKLSTKADACPNCGAKIETAPGAGAQLFGSLMTLGLFLWLGSKALEALSTTETKDPQILVQELEAKCAKSAKDAPANMGNKKDFYETCVFGGKSQLRAQGIIK